MARSMVLGTSPRDKQNTQTLGRKPIPSNPANVSRHYTQMPSQHSPQLDMTITSSSGLTYQLHQVLHHTINLLFALIDGL